MAKLIKKFISFAITLLNIVTNMLFDEVETRWEPKYPNKFVLTKGRYLIIPKLGVNIVNMNEMKYKSKLTTTHPALDLNQVDIERANIA